MGFSCEDIIAAVTDKLKQSAKKPGDAMLSNLLAAILSKAPKTFLTTLDTSEFAEAVILCAQSTEALMNSSASLFVKSLSGKEICYISVVMKDCPFIINTFNNIIARLGLSELVILHPVIKAGGLSVSVSILVFQGIDLKAKEDLLAEFKRTLPLLARACADFGVMTQIALEQAKRCLQSANSRWAVDFSELLKWLANGGFIFLGAVTARAVTNTSQKSFPSSCSMANHAGILAFDSPEYKTLIGEIETDYQLFHADENLRVSKLTMISPCIMRDVCCMLRSGILLQVRCSRLSEH